MPGGEITVSGALNLNSLRVKPAFAPGSNLSQSSMAGQVKANSEQTFGRRPLRVSYKKPASSSSRLTLCSVASLRQPRGCMSFHATDRSPLLSPRYCAATSISSFRAWGDKALKKLGLNNDISAGGDYTVPMAWAKAIDEADSKWDGILYVSRQHNAGLAVAVFERSGVTKARSRKLEGKALDQLCDEFGAVAV